MQDLKMKERIKKYNKEKSFVAAQERIDQTAREVFSRIIESDRFSDDIPSQARWSYDAAEALELERAKRIAAQKGEE